MNSVTIRTMTAEDTAEVAALSAECFSMPWSHNAIAAELSNPQARTLVAIADGRFAGFVNAQFVLDEGYINNVAVCTDCRRQGIGGVLISTLVELAQVEYMAFLSLEVRESNTAAIKLYEAHGFTAAGLRKGFYDRPKENALILTSNLVGN